MGRIRVESSSLAEVEYDETTCTLDVVFQTGSLYRYLGVPAVVYNSLLHADSKGAFFNQHIKDQFASARLQRAKRPTRHGY